MTGLGQFAGFLESDGVSLSEISKGIEKTVTDIAREARIPNGDIFIGVGRSMIAEVVNEGRNGSGNISKLVYNAISKSQGRIAYELVKTAMLSTHGLLTDNPGQASRQTYQDTYTRAMDALITSVAVTNGLQNYLSHATHEQIEMIRDKVQMAEGAINVANAFRNRIRSGAILGQDQSLDTMIQRKENDPMTKMSRMLTENRANAARGNEYQPIEYGPGVPLEWFPTEPGGFFFPATDYIGERIVQVDRDRFVIVKLIEDNIGSDSPDAINDQPVKGIKMDEALHRIYAMEVGSINADRGADGPLNASAANNARLASLMALGVVTKTAFDLRNGYHSRGSTDNPKALWFRKNEAPLMERVYQYSIAKHMSINDLMSHPVVRNQTINALTRSYRILKTVPVGFQTDECLARIQKEITELVNMDRALYWVGYRDETSFQLKNQTAVSRLIASVSNGQVTPMENMRFQPVIPTSLRKEVSKILTNILRHRVNMLLPVKDEVENAEHDYEQLEGNYLVETYQGTLGKMLREAFVSENGVSISSMIKSLLTIYPEERRNVHLPESAAPIMSDVDLLLRNRQFFSSDAKLDALIQKVSVSYNEYLRAHQDEMIKYAADKEAYNLAVLENKRREQNEEPAIPVTEPVRPELKFDFVGDSDEDADILTALFGFSELLEAYRNRQIVFSQDVSITSVRFTIGEMGILLYKNMAAVVDVDMPVHGLMEDILTSYEQEDIKPSQYFIVTQDGSTIEFARSVMDGSGATILAKMTDLPIIEAPL